MPCGIIPSLQCQLPVPTLVLDHAQMERGHSVMAIPVNKSAWFGMLFSRLPKRRWLIIALFSLQSYKKWVYPRDRTSLEWSCWSCSVQSSGCVNVCASTNPDPSQPDNPGLMQSDGGSTFIGNSASDSDQQASITQMIIDGTQGTADGDGLVQCINQYGNIYEVSILGPAGLQETGMSVANMHRPLDATTQDQWIAPTWTTVKEPLTRTWMTSLTDWLGGCMSPQTTITVDCVMILWKRKGLYCIQKIIHVEVTPFQEADETTLYQIAVLMIHVR